MTATRASEATTASAPGGRGGPGSAPPPRQARERPAWLGGLLGAVLLIAAWEILALTVFHKPGSGVPTPTSVLS
ncbi:MAG: ABC transporter permease, partial [Acidimicrobiales bacterium]